MSDYKLYNYKAFRKEVLEKRKSDEPTAEEVNEGALRNLAMTAALAASSFGSALGQGSPNPSSNGNINGAPTHMTTTGTHAEPKSTIHATSTEVDAALNKLEHRKMFKMKYNGDKGAIIGIGAYDYPVYRDGSPELLEYTQALDKARQTAEKFFWANGLVYANPEVATPAEAKAAQVATATSTGTKANVDPMPVAASTTAATPAAAAPAEHGMSKLKMSDISSFIVKAQGLWDFRAKGGKLAAKVNGVPRVYSDKNAFVRDYVAIEYPLFAKNRFQQTVDASEVTALIDDALSRVGESLTATA